MQAELLTTEVPQTFDFRFSNVSALIVKLTKRCNLNCTYCYENIVKDGDMTIDTFKDIASRAIVSSDRERIDFILHGGEPTLLPTDFFIEAFEFCNELAESHNKKVKFSIQTNLLALPTDKLKVFKDYKVCIGASTDGPDIANSMRLGSAKFLKNFLKAQEHGLRVGILMTINQSNYNRFNRITDWLWDELKVEDFKANVVYSVGTGINLPAMLPEYIFEAQKTILDNMFLTQGKKLIERNLSWQLDWYFRENFHKENSLCHAKTCGAGKKVLGITPDGKLLPCGRFDWSDTEHELGFLMDTPAIEKFDSKVHHFHSLVPENWYNCDSCEASKICNYGCQAFIARSKSKANVECLPTKMLYQYFQENEEQLKIVHDELLKRKFLHPTSYKDQYYGDGEQSPYVDKYDDETYKDYKDYKDN